jgi:hypothetical protein
MSALYDRLLLAQINFNRPHPLPSFISGPRFIFSTHLSSISLALSHIISCNVARRANTAFPYPADPASSSERFQVP